MAELKIRSPSEGALLASTPAKYVTAVKAGGAHALSVVVEPQHFGGSPGLARRARRFGLPILVKDFIVDPRQIDAAAHVGASAVLLIERILDTDRREALVRRAHNVGLEVVLELHSPRDVERSQATRADVVGINARDLDTLAVDAAGAQAMLQRARRQFSQPILRLSGIRTPLDVAAALRAGACGVLVGTSLLRSSDPELHLRALRRPLVKVCGVRTLSDVEAAREADLVGIVVASPSSPREVDATTARLLVQAVRANGGRSVLVTRTTQPRKVLNLLRSARPAAIQVHGFQPTPAFVRSAHRAGAHVYRAVSPTTTRTIVPDGVDGYVVDQPRGGSGKRVALRAAADLIRRLPGIVLLAGGLDAASAPGALRATGAFGVDASSRLESRPGHKDRRRIQAFVRAGHRALEAGP